MNRIILATLCFLAVSVYAQQFGNISVATVTSGVTVTSVLPITTDEDNYDVQVYKFWVPTNASGATIQFLNTNQGDCSWLHLFLRSDGLPCSYHDYPSSDYVCANAYDPGNGVKTQTVNMYPGFDQELFFWATNQYHYIAIGRYSDYSDKACSYTFNVTVNYNCSNNQVAIGGSSSTTCVNYVAATSGTPVQQSVDQMYKIVVADNTGNVQVVVNSTSTDVDIYAANFYGPSTNSYQYYTTSYVTSGDYYIYTLNCYTPRAGDFYVYVDLSSTASNNTVTITSNVCGTGLGGFNCSFNATAVNLTAIASTSGVTVYSPSYNGWLSYGFSYFYIDVPSARLGYNSIKITANSASTGFMYIRRGGFNENSATYGYEDSNEYEAFPAGFYLNNFEYGVAGRIYFGLACSSTTADCMITLSANTTNNAPVTTGMDIGVTTMAASDSASYILAPFVAAIVALVAMMF